MEVMDRFFILSYLFIVLIFSAVYPSGFLSEEY